MLPSLQVENAGFLLEGKNKLGSDAPERMKVLPYTYCGPGKGSSSLPTPSSNISRIQIAVKPLLSSLSPRYNKHVCIFITVVSSPIRVLQWSGIQHLHKESCYHSWEASIWRCMGTKLRFLHQQHRKYNPAQSFGVYLVT